MTKSTPGIYRTLVTAAACWLAFIAVQTYLRWPTMPLDMNARNPQVGAAYGAAVFAHALRAAELGAAGLTLAVALWWLLKRLNRN
jgi:energy-converting hydrogenase Eha subunit B